MNTFFEYYNMTKFSKQIMNIKNSLNKKAYHKIRENVGGKFQ